MNIDQIAELADDNFADAVNDADDTDNDENDDIDSDYDSDYQTSLFDEEHSD